MSIVLCQLVDRKDNQPLSAVFYTFMLHVFYMFILYCVTLHSTLMGF